MKRRDFLKKSLMAFGGAALGGCSNVNGGLKLANNSNSATVGRKLPNIIYILADDLGFADLGCYGQKLVKTPNLDKMAAEGMKFTSHYAGSTVCAPSRCVLMTGLHTGHCYIRGNATLPLRDSDVTVAELCKKSGYATGCFGKWGLGEAGTTGHPNNQGFDLFYGYLNQSNAHHYYPNYIYRDGQREYLNGEHYTHDMFASEAVRFIKDNKDKPFFLYLPFTIPHAELVLPEDKIIDEYQELGWPETPYGSATSHYGYQETPKAAFAAMVTRLDRDCGKILDLLKELKIDDNTLVIFTSDNGPHQEGGAAPTFFDSNGIYRGIKRDLYEGGVREPMIAWWPGKIKPGSETDHISAFEDFMPTVAEMIGQKIPENIDGVSYLPTILGKGTQVQKDYVYWEFFEGGGKQAIRQGKWKGVRLNMSTVVDPPVQLYDLDADPGETNNIASSNSTKAEELRELMKQAHVKSPNFQFAVDKQ
ncbi:MAG: sulfatase-like hydrolase/transferase [Phycisphaerae bacterium]|nr:sulfatase-like hydrolase/transferase [Phycisphaerae bacterium]